MSNTPSKTAALRWGGLANTGSNTEEDLLQIQAQVPGALVQAWIDSSGTPWGNLRVGGSSPTPPAPIVQGVVQGTVYGITANGQFVYDAVTTNNSKTITSVTANFTPADVGKLVWGIHANLGAASSLTVPQGTITAVNSSTSITVSVAANASQTNITLAWGTDDTAACIAAWIACFSSTANTLMLLLPSGYIFLQQSVFLTGFVGFPGAGHLKAAGLISSGFSWMVPTPNFSVASVPTNTSGILWHDNGNSGDSNPNYGYLANVGVFGYGYTGFSGLTNNSWLVLQQNYNNNCWVWLAGVGIGMTLLGPVICINPVSWCVGSATGMSVSGGQLVSMFNAYAQGSVSLAVGPSGNLMSYGATWGQSYSGVSIVNAGNFNSYGEQYDGASGFSNARAIDAETGSFTFLDGAQFISTANQYGINIFSGAKVVVRSSIINLTAGSAVIALVNAAGIFIADETNTYLAGTQPGIIAADITPSTGWGTSGAAGNGVSAVSGDARRFQFTITAAGTPGANPTIAITLPWTLPRTPLFICQQVNGTGAVASLTGQDGASTTGLTVTWNGTPVAAKTYVFNFISE